MILRDQLVLVVISVLFTANVMLADSILENKWQSFFSKTAKLTKVAGMKDGEEAYEVHDAKQQLLGWVLRSDSIDPKVKGKRGEISMLVAIKPDGRIAGVKVLDHKEDKKWFDKITTAFYKSFTEKKVDGDENNVHAITGATVSSQAMIDDVFQSSASFLENESVKQFLLPDDTAENSK